MTVAQLKPVEPAKKREPRVRIEAATPAEIHHVVRLFESSMKEFPTTYPDITRENSDDVAMHLYNYLRQRTTVAFTAKIGRKTVGHVLADVRFRPVGTPHHFLYVWNFYVEPDARKRGAAKALWEAAFQKAKASGILFWEADATEELAKTMTGYGKVPVREIYRRVGGNT
jgi:predicted N-acetyltransferase YhbS